MGGGFPQGCQSLESAGQLGIMEWFRWEGTPQAHLVQPNRVIFTSGFEGQVGHQENREKPLPKSQRGYLLLVKQQLMA